MKETKYRSNETCRASRNNLRCMLLWPSFDKEDKPDAKFYFGIALYVCITFPLPIFVLIHLIQTLRGHVDIPIIENIAFVTSSSGIYYMVFVNIKYLPQIAQIIKDTSNFGIFKPPKRFNKLNEKLNFWSNANFIYITVCAVIYYPVKYFLDKKDCVDQNIEKHLHEVCGLVLPFWLPFSLEDDFSYFAFFSYTVIAGQFFIKPAVMTTFILFEISQHVILRIHEFREMLKDCLRKEPYEITRCKLTRCILYHQQIINLATNLDKFFSDGMMTHVAITGIVCGCIEKQFLNGDRLCAVLHGSGWLMTLAFDCVAGQFLINASETIPKAIWESEWYECDPSLRKDILFLLERSQKNFVLNAGGFQILSYPLLIGVAKMSYSFLCLLTS